jgi:hypothetical protein
MSTLLNGRRSSTRSDLDRDRVQVDVDDLDARRGTEVAPMWWMRPAAMERRQKSLTRGQVISCTLFGVLRQPTDYADCKIFPVERAGIETGGRRLAKLNQAF